MSSKQHECLQNFVICCAMKGLPKQAKRRSCKDESQKVNNICQQNVDKKTQQTTHLYVRIQEDIMGHGFRTSEYNLSSHKFCRHKFCRQRRV